MKTLREILGKPIMFHLVCYQNKDGKMLAGYDSRDPSTIGDQLTRMQAWGGEGAGVIALTYGPTVSPFIHAACMEVWRQCNNRKMPFAICLDPWTSSPAKTLADITPTIIAAINHPDTQTMLNSRCYLAGKPVLDFHTGADARLVNANTNAQLWQADVQFSWIYTPDPLTPLMRINSLATMRLPAVAFQFDDGTGPDRNKSVWNQTQPARIVPSRSGGLFRDMAAVAPLSCQYIQVVTFNDWNESTDCEKWASIV